MSHQQLTQPRQSATLQSCGVPSRVIVLLLQTTLLRYQHVPRVHVPSQVSLLPICSSRWTMGRGKVRIGHRISVSTRVQHVIRIIHCALQQSIERDKSRTVNIMNLIVSDTQRWKFSSHLQKIVVYKELVYNIYIYIYLFIYVSKNQKHQQPYFDVYVCCKPYVFSSPVALAACVFSF